MIAWRFISAFQAELECPCFLKVALLCTFCSAFYIAHEANAYNTSSKVTHLNFKRCGSANSIPEIFDCFLQSTCFSLSSGILSVYVEFWWTWLARVLPFSYFVGLTPRENEAFGKRPAVAIGSVSALNEPKVNYRNSHVLTLSLGVY